MGLMLISPLNLPLQRYSFLRRRLEDLASKISIGLSITIALQTYLTRG
jgi:hypothetical protein